MIFDEQQEEEQLKWLELANRAIKLGDSICPASTRREFPLDSLM